MGCAASLPSEGHASINDWYTPPPPSQVTRGISMPAHAQYEYDEHSLHDFRIVPLSSSKYGISMNPSQYSPSSNSTELAPSSLQRDDSMTEVLKAQTGSPHSGVSRKRRVEVRSILEDLRPGIEKHIQQAANFPEQVCAAAHVEDPAAPISDPKLSYSESMPNARRGQSSASFKGSEGNPGQDCGNPSSQGATRLSTGRSRSSFLSRFLKKGSSLKKNCERKNGEPLSLSSHTMEREGSLFDADLLASYEDALKGLTQDEWNVVQSSQGKDLELDSSESRANEAKPNTKVIPDARKVAELIMKKEAMMKTKHDPLDKYEKLCPPGGEKAVVLYTTSLRGIRKTFEDCNRLRSLLESLCIIVDERDISMHQDFRNELKELTGGRPIAVPRLFIKGRYIGGAEEVLQLHEEEQLLQLLESLPRNQGPGRLCDGCGGARFVPCFDCCGSRKVFSEGREVIRCPYCNENGLIQCPICC